MATRSSILDWKIARTEEPGGLQFMGSQRAGCNFVTKQQQSKDLLYSTGNSIQHSATTNLDKESKNRVDICMCVASPLAVHLKLAQHCKSVILNKVLKNNNNKKTLLTVKTSTGYHFKPHRMAKMKSNVQHCALARACCIRNTVPRCLGDCKMEHCGESFGSLLHNKTYIHPMNVAHYYVLT